MQQVEHSPNRAASRHIVRAAALLNRAERHLSAANYSSSDRFLQEQLQGLAFDLRRLDAPLYRLSNAVRFGGERSTGFGGTIRRATPTIPNQTRSETQ